MNKSVEIQDLGFKDYKDTWDYQEQLFKSIVDTKIKNRREDAGIETPLNPSPDVANNVPAADKLANKFII